MRDGKTLPGHYVVPVICLKLIENSVVTCNSAGLNQGPGNVGILMQWLFDNIRDSSFFPLFKAFGIYLFHHPKTTKLPFGMVIIAMMIFVLADKPVSGYFVFNCSF